MVRSLLKNLTHLLAKEETNNLYLGKEVANILRTQRKRAEQELTMDKLKSYHADTSPDINNKESTSPNMLQKLKYTPFSDKNDGLKRIPSPRR